MCFASLKSYDGFLIAIHASQGLKERYPWVVDIYAGRHLQALASAPCVSHKIRWLHAHEEEDERVAFHLRKRGIVAATRSLLALRAKVSDLLVAEPIFDRSDWRERVISGPHRSRGLSQARNIHRVDERVSLGLARGYKSATYTARFQGLVYRVMQLRPNSSDTHAQQVP